MTPLGDSGAPGSVNDGGHAAGFTHGLTPGPSPDIGVSAAHGLNEIDPVRRNFFPVAGTGERLRLSGNEFMTPPSKVAMKYRFVA
jgi:hypothetical protein